MESHRGVWMVGFVVFMLVIHLFTLSEVTIVHHKGHKEKTQKDKDNVGAGSKPAQIIYTLCGSPYFPVFSVVRDKKL